MQEGFDTGYSSGYKKCHPIGVARGLVSALMLKESNDSVLCDKLNVLLEKFQWRLSTELCGNTLNFCDCLGNNYDGFMKLAFILFN